MARCELARIAMNLWHWLSLATAVLHSQSVQAATLRSKRGGQPTVSATVAVDVAPTAKNREEY